MIQWLSRRQRRRTSFSCTLKKGKIILSELHFKFKSSKDNEKASLWAIFNLDDKRNCSLSVTTSWLQNIDRDLAWISKNNAVTMLWYIKILVLSTAKSKALMLTLSKQTSVSKIPRKNRQVFSLQQPHFLQQFCQWRWAHRHTIMSKEFNAGILLQTFHQEIGLFCKRCNCCELCLLQKSTSQTQVALLIYGTERASLFCKRVNITSFGLNKSIKKQKN